MEVGSHFFPPAPLPQEAREQGLCSREEAHTSNHRIIKRLRRKADTPALRLLGSVAGRAGRLGPRVSTPASTHGRKKAGWFRPHPGSCPAVTAHSQRLTAGFPAPNSPEAGPGGTRVA